MGILDAYLVASFHEHGFVTVADAVQPAELAALREAFAGWVEESRAHTAAFGQMLDSRPRFDVEPRHGAGNTALRPADRDLRGLSAGAAQSATTDRDVSAASPSRRRRRRCARARRSSYRW